MSHHVTTRPRLFVCVAIFCLIAPQCRAQQPEWSGRAIVDVQYAPENVLHPVDIERVQVLKPGSPLRSEDIAEAIDRLFSTGQFEDIAAEVEPCGSGVIVRFVTQPATFLRGLSVQANNSQSPNRGELASSAQLQLGTRLQQQDVTDALNRMRGLLERN